MITLLVGFYHEPILPRRRELVTCLERNVSNTLVDEVCVFLEDDRARDDMPTLPRLRIVEHGHRVCFSDFFDWANANLAGRTTAIANADIYFDDTIARVDAIDLSGKLLCLSRWDVRPDGSSRLNDRADSQDAWIFRPPVVRFPCDFELGVAGCDNRVAWEAREAGLVVSNPSRSVRAHHLHASGIRRPRPAITGPLLAVSPSSLD